MRSHRSMGIEKTATILTDVKAIASKLGVDYTALGPTLAACEAKRARAPASTPPKRKAKRAAIDLTQSDSEDDAKPKRARVEPWETPAWKAHMAEEKKPLELPSSIFAKARMSRRPNLYSPERLEKINRFRASLDDEEEWRKIHDPVGHKRMWLYRIHAKKDWTKLFLKSNLDKKQFIESQVKEFARESNLPYRRPS
mmetsp:Transcript_14944/g.48812  ORF Transcript_14944/g.48812 Transcript_14944/m.48812 type:complete len:197 (-) Transcript_14944:81-671(-)